MISTRKIRAATILAGLGTTIFSAGLAYAETVSLPTGEIQIGKVIPGEIKRNRGPGADMVVSAVVGKTILSILSQSTSTPAKPDGRIEMFVAGVQIQPKGPVVTVPEKQITDYNLDRGLRKPTIAAAAGEAWAAVFFASTKDNKTNPYHFVRIIGENGNWLSDAVRMNPDDNKDHGASHSIFVGKDGNDFVFLDGDNKNGDQSDLYTVRVNMTAGTPKISVLPPLKLTDCSICRPVCEVTGDMKVTCCSAAGDSRPPPIGVMCGNVDIRTQKITTKAIIGKSDPDKHIFANSPSMVVLPGGKLGIMHTLSKGRGNNGGDQRVKGAPERAVLVTVDGATLQPIDSTNKDTTSIAQFARHGELTFSHTKADGSTVIAALAGGSGGSGSASLRDIVIGLDGKIAKIGVTKVVAPYVDLQFWTQMGNNNPNTQGSGHQTTLPGIANPNFGVITAWQPDVKTFMIVPTAHFATEEIANPKVRQSAYLSFVPTEVSPAVQPTFPSGVVPTSDIPVGPAPRLSGSPAESDDVSESAKGDQSESTSGSRASLGDTGTGCSTSPNPASGGGAATFGLIGAALALASTRRRQARS